LAFCCSFGCSFPGMFRSFFMTSQDCWRASNESVVGRSCFAVGHDWLNHWFLSVWAAFCTPCWVALKLGGVWMGSTFGHFNWQLCFKLALNCRFPSFDQTSVMFRCEKMLLDSIYVLNGWCCFLDFDYQMQNANCRHQCVCCVSVLSFWIGVFTWMCRHRIACFWTPWHHPLSADHHVWHSLCVTWCGLRCRLLQRQLVRLTLLPLLLGGWEVDPVCMCIFCCPPFCVLLITRNCFQLDFEFLCLAWWMHLWEHPLLNFRLIPPHQTAFVIF